MPLCDPDDRAQVAAEEAAWERDPPPAPHTWRSVGNGSCVDCGKDMPVNASGRCVSCDRAAYNLWREQLEEDREYRKEGIR